MRYIWKREMANYFKTPVGYVFLIMFTLITGVFYVFVNIEANASSSVYTLLGSVRLPVMLIVPILTMRLLADERRTRTDQLLFTSPLSIPAIVVGKYLAACTVFLLALASTLLYSFLIAPYSAVDPGAAFAVYLYFFLMNGCVLSVGVLVSALCENQVSAGLISLGANLLMYVIDSSVLPQLDAPYLRGLYDTLSWLLFLGRFPSSSLGIIGFADILYFISFSGVMLFLSVRIIDRRRWAERGTL